MTRPETDLGTLVHATAREVWTGGEFELLDERYHDDVTGGVVGHYEFSGTTDYETWVRESRRAFPDLEVRVDWCFEQERLVCGKWTATGTHSGELNMFDLATLPPTNVHVEYSGLFIVRAEDGQIVEEWHASDFITLFLRLMNSSPARTE